MKLRSLVLWLAFFALQAYYARDILFKGQRIKQFHSYAVSTSLAEANFHPLHTTLPCASSTGDEGLQRWAEEPPIFHTFAALLMKAGFRDAAVAPFLVSIFTALAVAFCLRGEMPDQANLLAFLFAATPLFSRYVSQHMPDMLAVGFAALGVAYFRRGDREKSTAFFAAAVTTKATFVFPFFFFLLPELRRTSTWGVAFRRAVGFSFMALMPFLFWLVILHAEVVPNPFSFHSVLANRHSGTWSLLLDPEFYTRMWTWLAAKGVGLPLFFAALIAWGRGVKNSKFRADWAWWSVTGTFAYWLLVRGGNFTHDYYTLPFLLGWVVLGGRELLAIRPAVLRRILLSASIASGIWQPFSLARHLEAPPTGAPPSYCGQEAGLPVKEAP